MKKSKEKRENGEEKKEFDAGLQLTCYTRCRLR